MKIENKKIYAMNLNDEPFNSIKYGNKRIEMRLFDERRQLLRIGDYITFINRWTNETLCCQIENLERFNSFEELYKHYSKQDLGYNEDEIASPKDMLKYYSEDKIKKYGVLAIKISSPIKNN